MKDIFFVFKVSWFKLILKNPLRVSFREVFQHFKCVYTPNFKQFQSFMLTSANLPYSDFEYITKLFTY